MPDSCTTGRAVSYTHLNIYEDNGKWHHHDYQAEVSDLHLAEFFFPEDIAYGTPGNEVSFTLAAYTKDVYKRQAGI